MCRQAGTREAPLGWLVSGSTGLLVCICTFSLEGMRLSILCDPNDECACETHPNFNLSLFLLLHRVTSRRQVLCYGLCWGHAHGTRRQRCVVSSFDSSKHIAFKLLPLSFLLPPSV